VVDEHQITRRHGADSFEGSVVVYVVPARPAFFGEVVDRIVVIWFGFTEKIFHIEIVAQMLSVIDKYLQ